MNFDQYSADLAECWNQFSYNSYRCLLSLFLQSSTVRNTFFSSQLVEMHLHEGLDLGHSPIYYK